MQKLIIVQFFIYLINVVMKNKIFLLLSLCIFSYAKEVLLLHSYHKGYEWTDSISKAVEDSFKYTDIELTTEYMDTKRVYDNQYTKKLLDFYQQRYKNRKFDLIIASDNNALDFLNKYHNKIFQDIPIIFCGINNFKEINFDKYMIKSRTSGIIEQTDIEKNIQLIKKFHPNLSKLLVLNDTTTTGKQMQKEFLQVYEKYKNDMEIEYIDKFKIEELQEKVKQLPKNSAILFLLLFKDETGKIFTFKDGLKQIESVSNVPIYGLWDFYLNYGLVGGFLTNAYKQGQYAADLSKQALSGKNIKNIPIVDISPNSYIFDYHKLKEFNIKKRVLPKNSIIKNKPFSFYETYKTRIFLVITIFVIFIIIIFFLIVSLIEKRKAKNEFRVQLRFIQTLLDTIKNPIFYKNKQGKYIGCNEALCELIGKPKYEILGRTMYDFFSDQKEFLQAHEEIEKKLFNNQNVGEYTLDYVTPDGEIRVMLINKTLYHSLNGEINGILTVLHDITDLVKVQKEKKQHESFLAQQSKLAEIGEMISAIAHQWNEPLVEMSAIVQDLQLQYKTSQITNKDINDFVNDSMIQIQYMSKTLKDFRDFLKPSVKKTYFNIKDAFNLVFNIIERQIKYSYIDLNIDYKTNELTAYGYKNEFMQVLITIINNSKDAILKVKKDLPTHKGKINIIVLTQNKITKILIQDNGCGVKEENQEKAFDPYFSTKTKGNGIGLYMSKVLIADKMNGKIYFLLNYHLSNSDITTLIIELPRNNKEK